MKSFLEEVAEDIIKKYTNNFQEVCIVIPNKRTGTYLKKHIGRILGTGFSPRILTIEQFVRKTTGLQLVDKFTLSYRLYQIYLALLEPADEKPAFDNFMSLAEILLSDFNELDAYLIDINQVFTNIQTLKEADDSLAFLTDEQKEILQQFWKNFSVEKMSEEKERFLKLWNKVPEMYKKISTDLLNNGKAYQGLMFRKLVDDIKTGKHEPLKYSVWAFVGFNALNKAEKVLFKHYKQSQKAEFYWDTDQYYHLDEKQEAGEFLRANFNFLTFPDKDLPRNFCSKTKRIQLVGVPLRIGQAKSIATILQSEAYAGGVEQGHYTDTAVVLADEHLLFPVMHSLPDNFKSVNVTMGYPFSQTTLYSFIENYLYLHRNNKGSYYYKDVFKILKHPIIKRYQWPVVENFIQKAHLNNQFRITYREIEQMKTDFFNLVFKPYTSADKGLLLLENLMEILFKMFVMNKKTNDVSQLENEYVFQLYVQLKRTYESLSQSSVNPSEFSYAVIERILWQEMRNIRIPFESMSTEGLQLMGMIETRNIDFKNVIVTGLNEGVFPSLSRSPSFISENLRHAFGLTVIKHQDAIFAYLFYRLLQRAENITLVYNNITGNNSGELSRFVQQLLSETKHTIVHTHFKQDLIPVPRKAISVESNPQITQKLNAFVVKNQKSDRRFSPSAISSYLDCRLKFYFRYIAEIKDAPEIKEDLEPNDMGTILHAAIEFLYKNYLKNNKKVLVEKSDFSLLRKQIDENIDAAFAQFWKIDDVKKVKYEGNSIIMRDVVKLQINNILKHDEAYAPFEIVGLEAQQNYYSDVDINANGTQFKVGIKGIIDRIDKKDNVYRVLDYKTGKTDDKLTNWNEVFDRSNPKRKTVFMQVFWYAELFYSRFKNPTLPLQPAIYNVNKMRKADYSPYLNVTSAQQSDALTAYNMYNYLDEFKQELADVFAEIYSPDVVFEQTTDQQKCKYCNYQIICGR